MKTRQCERRAEWRVEIDDQEQWICSDCKGMAVAKIRCGALSKDFRFSVIVDAWPRIICESRIEI